MAGGLGVGVVLLLDWVFGWGWVGLWVWGFLDGVFGFWGWMGFLVGGCFCLGGGVGCGFAGWVFWLGGACVWVVGWAGVSGWGVLVFGGEGGGC